MRLLAIARREAAALFRSPLAWVVLAAVQGTVAFMFLLHLDGYLQLQPQLRAAGNGPGMTAYLVPQLFGAATSVQLMALPLLTMNLLAGERRRGTLPLLLSAPVSTIEIVLGKYLGLLAILALLVVLTACMPLSLAFATDLDAGLLAGATLGNLLFVAGGGAAGLFLSALTRDPTIAAIATLGLLLVLFLLGTAQDALGAPWGPLLAYPAPATHLAPFFRGLFDTRAFAYFVLFGGFFLALATRRLDQERL